MSFPTRVNAQPAPAVPGGFAGCNPRAAVLAPPGGYVAAPDYPASFGGATKEALIVGRFAWFNYATGQASNYYQPGSILGFVQRQNGMTVIKDFLGESRLGFQQGFPVTGHNQGDFYADFTPGPDAAGLTVYADPVTGQATAAAAGQGVQFAITASLANTGVLTVTVTAGTLAVGQVVTGTNVPVGSFITAQLTGTAGSTGTYQLNQGATVGSEAMVATGKVETKFKLAQPVAGAVAFTGAWLGTVVPAGAPFAGLTVADGLLTVSAVASGTLAPGQLLGGTNVPAFAQILSQKSGTPGGTGVYLTNLFALIASESLTAGQGDTAKISTWQA